jgi:SM-20-related protein
LPSLKLLTIIVLAFFRHPHSVVLQKLISPCYWQGCHEPVEIISLPLSRNHVQPAMISLRILLRGGHCYETSCSADAPLLNELRMVLGGGGVADIQIGHDGKPKGVAISASQIVAVETVPPVALKRAPALRITPAPYIRVPEFLSKDENAAVMAFALRKHPEFIAGEVETGEQNYRYAQVLTKFHDLGVDFEGRLRELLPDVVSYLGMQLPAGYGVEMQLTAHGDTGYFKIHNDNGTPRTASRFLTYVYYFSRQPQPFSGGQLRLYDESQVDPSSWVPVASYAEIAPQNNMLLFFPSRCFHEVMPTLTRVNEFANARFTINGWVRTGGVPVRQAA